jgi:hypothetical protein
MPTGSQGTPARRGQAFCRNPANLPGTSQGLWQPTHSRGAQSAWYPVFMQAGRAADAAVGLISWTQAITQTDAASAIRVRDLHPIISIASLAPSNPIAKR